VADEAKAADRIGETYGGKYRILGVLGVGGMGAVYDALHTYTDRRVALKIMHAGVVGTEAGAARFLREARAASSIGHPAIVDVIDAGREDDGSVYLALELLEGESLGAAITRGSMPTSMVVAIAVQILEGLGAAHERGIVHRDVKPENVFLVKTSEGDRRVKLLDFGIAKQINPGQDLGTTIEGTVLGTPYYMSPEQAGGDVVDARADLWSTGALLFHALAGRPPFAEENYNKQIARILGGAAPSLATVRPDLPAWLVRVVDRALDPDKEKRWQTAREMSVALQTRGGDAPGRTAVSTFGTAATVSVNVGRSARRRTWLALAAVGFGLVSALAILVTANEDAPRQGPAARAPLPGSKVLRKRTEVVAAAPSPAATPEPLTAAPAAAAPETAAAARPRARAKRPQTAEPTRHEPQRRRITPVHEYE